MPSYLGNYKGAAKDRDKKIVRAIKSVQAQTFTDWELLVIADGCDKTVEIVRDIPDPRIKIFKIPKQKIWSGTVRNTGIQKSEGEYICYLDIDDAFHPAHLAEILVYLQDKSWYWMDDYVWNGSEFRHRKCDINRIGQCGTSNLIHKKIAWWNEKDNYAHDWQFINNLRGASGDYEYIKAGKYLVCHVPGRTDI